jgi:tetratricopeptide (TPR) repeat protein
VEDHRVPLAELRRLLELQRAYELAGRADQLLAADRAADAGALYRRAAALAPESDELLFWAGLALAHAGDLDDGVDAIRRAIDAHPGWGVLLERLSPTFAPAGHEIRRALARQGAPG